MSASVSFPLCTARQAGSAIIRPQTANGWSLSNVCAAPGVQVDALAEYVALFQQGDATASARKQILVEQRDRLLKQMTEMQTTLARLDQKIQNYEAALLPAENHLQKAQAIEI